MSAATTKLAVAETSLEAASAVAPPRARLAVEHGGTRNTGDLAMLVNVVRKFQARAPWIELVLARHGAEDPDLPESLRGAYEGLGEYYRAVTNGFYGGFHKIVPRALRPSVLGACIAFAAARVFLSARLSRTFGGTPLCPKRARSCLRALAEADALFVAGRGGVTDGFLNTSVYGIHSEVICARLMGKPVFLSGQGLGPLRSRLGRRFVAAAFKRCTAASVREPESLAFLREIGVKREDIRCLPDDAYDLAVDEETVREMRRRMTRLFNPPAEFLAVFNVRPTPNARRNERDWIIPATIIRRLLREPGAGVVLVPMLTRNETELGFHRRLVDRVGDPRCVLLDEFSLQPEKTKAAVGAANLAVGYPYHFLLFALSQRVPTVAVFETDYYRQKVDGLRRMYVDDLSSVEAGEAGWEEGLERALENVLPGAREWPRPAGPPVSPEATNPVIEAAVAWLEGGSVA